MSPNVHFVRENQTLVDDLPVAVGGTATVQLQCWFSEDPGSASFDLPSVATTEPDPAASVELNDATLVVHGLHEGTTTVVISSSDGSTTYGSLGLEVAPIDHLAFRTTYDDIPPNVDAAFAKELGTLAEVLLASSGGGLLADDNMQLVLPTGAVLTGIRPGVFDYNATPLGDGVVEVNSGGATYTTPFVVVDHADSIALVDPSVTIPATGSDVEDICFSATVGTRFVASLRWSFVIEGFSTAGSSCEPISSGEDNNHDGIVAMSATAGGASAPFNVPIQ